MFRTALIAIALTAATQSVAMAQVTGDKVICSIKRGEEVKSRAVCGYERTNKPGCGGEGCGQVQRFEWPDGDTTVLENVEESFTLNGREVGRRNFRINGIEWCFTNAATGNSFCYDNEAARGL